MLSNEKSFNSNYILLKLSLGIMADSGSMKVRHIIEYFGNIEDIPKAGSGTYDIYPEYISAFLKKLHSPNVIKAAETELEFICRHNIVPLWIDDDQYPMRLRECPDAPVVLYLKGNPLHDNEYMLAVVGTRSSTMYGEQICRNIISGLAQYGYRFNVISGLAYGIDACAHKSALDNGIRTWAVLGHGLNRLYPPSNRPIAESILTDGGLFTEFNTGYGLFPANFVKRNRIIAGLADAVLVIESAKKGGSLLTAGMANGYNREVLAVPGRITDKYSEGCNNLIKNNQAILVETAEDIALALGWEKQGSAYDIQTKIKFPSPECPVQKSIFMCLHEEGNVHIDRISEKICMPVQKLSTYLLDMILMGYIKGYPGQIYSL